MKRFFKQYIGILLAIISLGGFLFAFTIETNINNALQIIQSILITDDGLENGEPLMYLNTGNKLYINPAVVASGGNTSGLVLTLNNSGYISFTPVGVGTTGATGAMGATGADGIGLPQTLSLSGNDLTISSGNTISLSGLMFWSLFGNSATNPTIHFLGTTDNQDLVFKTNDTERMRILGTSGYVGIHTSSPTYPLTVSGGVYSQDNEVSFFAGSDATTVFGAPVGGILMGIDALASSGLFSRLSIYDLRGVGESSVGFNIVSQSGASSNNEFGDEEATINSKNGEYLDLGVSDRDFTNFDFNLMTGFVLQNSSEIDMEDNFIQLKSKNAEVITISGGSELVYTTLERSFVDMTPNYINIYGWSGSSANMYFDSMLGLFGFGTNTPDNTVDIGSSYIGGNTLGLRFSARGGNSGQILGLDGSGDVILLGNIAGFGGGSPNYWTQSSNFLYPSTLSNFVGIGTNNPQSALHVSGNIQIDGLQTGSSGDYLLVESNGVIKRITQAGALANTGGNLKEFVYRLTPAEIYTIHNTPYVVLSPTAPNKYIEISVMMIEYDFKTTAYIGGSSSIAMYMGSSSSSACNINYTTLTSSFSDKVHRCTGQSGAPTGPLFNPGDSLMIGGTQPANPLTTGDGDLVIRILYREHTFGQ